MVDFRSKPEADSRRRPGRASRAQVLSSITTPCRLAVTLFLCRRAARVGQKGRHAPSRRPLQDGSVASIYSSHRASTFAELIVTRPARRRRAEDTRRCMPNSRKVEGSTLKANKMAGVACHRPGNCTTRLHAMGSENDTQFAFDAYRQMSPAGYRHAFRRATAAGDDFTPAVLGRQYASAPTTTH